MDADITQTKRLLHDANVHVSVAAIMAWTPSQRMAARTWALLEIDAQRRGDPGNLWPDFLLETLEGSVRR